MSYGYCRKDEEGCQGRDKDIYIYEEGVLLLFRLATCVRTYMYVCTYKWLLVDAKCTTGGSHEDNYIKWGVNEGYEDH